jgi:hypothetical protein
MRQAARMPQLHARRIVRERDELQFDDGLRVQPQRVGVVRLRRLIPLTSQPHPNTHDQVTASGVGFSLPTPDGSPDRFSKTDLRPYTRRP